MRTWTAVAALSVALLGTSYAQINPAQCGSISANNLNFDYNFDTSCQTGVVGESPPRACWRPISHRPRFR
jgi:hypothetical protein